MITTTIQYDVRRTGIADLGGPTFTDAMNEGASRGATRRGNANDEVVSRATAVI